MVWMPITKMALLNEQLKQFSQSTYHAALHWPDMADPSLWPMAVDYCIYRHNHYPHAAAGMMAPIDLIVEIISSVTATSPVPAGLRTQHLIHTFNHE